MAWRWHEEPNQRAWLRVGALFLLWYLGEAFLFWGPEPRLRLGSATPLWYWGAFAVALVVALRWRQRVGARRSGAGAQSAVIAAAITVSAIGGAWLAMRRSGDVTLGHAILLGALAEAASVIGALGWSVGWLAAAACWFAGAGIVLAAPRVQDLTVGLAVGVGFIAVGALRRRAVHDD